MKRNKTVDEFLASNQHWHAELEHLRNLILQTEMTETIKWGFPVYTISGKNVVGLGSFKAYVGIWFYQGVFLQDKAGKLINAQEGKTKAMRQWRFQSADEIEDQLVLDYLQEAIDNQKAGKEVKPDRKKDMPMASELTSALDANASLADAWQALTPGKRREYAEYIFEAKRETTRISRLEKVTPMILAGQGLNDKYK